MSGTDTAFAATAATPAGVLDEGTRQRHSNGNCPRGRCRVQLPSVLPDNHRPVGQHDDRGRERRAARRPLAAYPGPRGFDGDPLLQARRAGFDSQLVHHRRGSGDRSPNVPAGKAREQAPIVQYNAAITGQSALSSQISHFQTHYPTPWPASAARPEGGGR